jgi:hypothetical protein
MDFENENGRYDGRHPSPSHTGEMPPLWAWVALYDLIFGSLAWPDEPRYERERSASPRPQKRDDGYRRERSASPDGRMNSRYDLRFPSRLAAPP